MAKVETIVFLSLILDLFAFTIPLPLFPRLIEWYTLVRKNPERILVLVLMSVYREKLQIRMVSCPGHSTL